LVVGLHGFFFRALYRMPMPRSWRTLSWAPYAHRFTRTDGETLELELVDGELHAPVHVGDVIELDGMRATVLSRSRVAFRFDRRFDDPELYFLAWRAGRLVHVLPPPIGEQLTL